MVINTVNISIFHDCIMLGGYINNTLWLTSTPDSEYIFRMCPGVLVNEVHRNFIEVCYC